MNGKEHQKRIPKKRGPYMQYLVDQNVKIPKVTKWRHKTARPNCNRRFEGSLGLEEDFIAEVDKGDDFAPTSPDMDLESNGFSKVEDRGDLLEPEYPTMSSEDRQYHQLNDPAISVSSQQLYDTYADDEEDLDYIDVDNDNADQPLDDDNNENKPIYPGARLTLASSMLLIITFVMRHGLTGAALTDLLVLLELHCISPNLCRKSVHLFHKFFKTLKAPIEFHYYCSHNKCKSYLGTVKVEICPVCKGCLSGKKEIMYFVVVPIMYQLENLFKDSKFFESITTYRQTRTKHCNRNIEDVMDGDLYKRHFGDDHFFKDTETDQKTNSLHISLQVNTDGVSLFRSSAFSVWPVYFVVNELHPLLRFKRKYRLFAGLWFGYEKPTFKTFMKPFAESLKLLYHKGATVKTHQGCELKVKALLLNGVFDSPARCLFQKLVQFNGWFGCPFCLHPGKTVKTSERGSTHAYPFNHKNMSTGCYEERSHDGTLKHAKDADKNLLEGKESAVNGVKGSTWFMFVPGFDIIKGISLDYMHCVLLGVTKMLLSLWFDKTYRSEDFYVGNKVNDVNRILTSIQPPHCITRAPRSLSELSHYKATEFKAFLLFYGAVCMWNILPDMYFQHFLLLVEATYLLLQDSISFADLKKASKLLKHFCINVQTLYGDRYETSNVHLLLHLVQKVKDLGPLWCNSCFYFEDYNGELRHLFHGTQRIDMQVTLAICIQQKIPDMEKLLTYGTSAFSFYEHLAGKKICLNNKTLISEGIYAIGKLTSCEITGSEAAAMEELLGGHILKCFKFTRLEFRGDVIHCIEYERVSRRNSYTVQFHKRNEGYGYGYVQYYAKAYQVCPNSLFCNDACSCKRPKYLAVIKCLQKSGVQLAHDDITGATIPHIIPVHKESAEITTIEVSDIVKLCLAITSHSEAHFVCHFPNRLEKD